MELYKSADPVKNYLSSTKEQATFKSANVPGLTSPLELRPKEEEGIPLRDWEKEFAASYPTTYQAGKFFSDFVPFLRFAYPSERDRFEQLETVDQVGSILLDTAFLALMSPWGRGVVGSALKAPFRALARPKNVRPASELVLEGVKNFDLTEASIKTLRRTGKLTREEAVAVAGGELGKLTGTFSKGLSESVYWKDWIPRLKPEIAGKLDPILLEEQHFASQYKKLAKRATADIGKLDSDTIGKVFTARSAKLFGVGSEKITLADAGVLHIQNMIDDLVRHPNQTRKLVSLGADNGFFNSFAPSRVVFGASEKIWGTKSKIYAPIVAANEVKNKYAARWTQLLWKDLEGKGLGKVVKSWASGNPEFVPAFSKEQYQQAFKFLSKTDDLMQGLRKQAIPGMLEKAQVEVFNEIQKMPEVVNKLVWAWYDFSDNLFADHMIKKIPRIFAKYDLTPSGRRGVGLLMRELTPKVTSNFSAQARSVERWTAQSIGVQEILKQARGALNHPFIGISGQHPWFNAKGEELAKLIVDLSKDLTMGSKGRFVQYLENYVARIGQRNAAKFSNWAKVLVPKDMQPGFLKHRTMAEGAPGVTDFSSMIEARISAQANDLYLYPRISSVVREIGKLPQEIKLYSHHWISRALNRPSPMDYRVGQWLSNSVGKIEETLGLASHGIWDDRRVQRLAGTINNLTHMGGLGFKPFSVIRNLFQPLVTVPADLGGLRDVVNLGYGALRALNPANRKAMRAMGIIADYAPELNLRARAIPFGPKIFGKQLPTLDKVRDVSMWMFRGSDNFNRYVTAGAAWEKWDRSLAKIGRDAILGGSKLEEFVRRSGISNRYSWVREELTGMLRRGDLEGARNAFIRDVVADTQFLYQPIESAIIAQKGGALGKTGFVFQSWWMNYGQLVAKWLQTGEPVTGQAGRLITAMTSQAIAYELMSQLFGEKRSAKALGFGPFPSEMNEFMIPPSWTPIYHSLRTVAALGALPFDGESEAVKKQAMAILNSTWMFLPGGLQIKGLVKEGWEGLPQSIIQLRRPESLGVAAKGAMLVPGLIEAFRNR